MHIPPQGGRVLQLDYIALICRTPDGRATRITDLEYQVLSLLLANLNRPLSAARICSELWQNPCRLENVRVFISKIRRKIEPDPSQPRYLLTIYQRGYMLTDLHLKPSEKFAAAVINSYTEQPPTNQPNPEHPVNPVGDATWPTPSTSR